MSNDKRMGVNPLDWMTPDSKPEADAAPSPAEAPAPAATPHDNPFFLPAEAAIKEDCMSKGKIKMKQTMDTSQALAHLQDLVQSMDAGVIRAEDGETQLVLGVADTLHFEMKLSKKKDKAKCSIEMEWLEDETKLANFKIKSEA